MDGGVRQLFYLLDLSFALPTWSFKFPTQVLCHRIIMVLWKTSPIIEFLYPTDIPILKALPILLMLTVCYSTWSQVDIKLYLRFIARSSATGVRSARLHESRATPSLGRVDAGHGVVHRSRWGSARCETNPSPFCDLAMVSTKWDIQMVSEL